ncbi:alkaline phosphatase D family protein [Halomonas sp. HP20-15]|uniref:alkaline phosphatase D family protein n=1 Tax=Halomonas sp. HP20-15 TaxID=3085901 RepID=UPI002982186E|nr:alkaline phosphatase D family protein [Halomonas sp. HP20-15]MDW5377878.1 alkaline phosphatase D family protein [Halomonas sp. HP20-15]
MDDRPAPPPATLDALPEVLAGPLLRRLEPRRVVLWLAASRKLDLTLTLHPPDDRPIEIALDAARCRQLRVGRHLVIQLIDISLEAPLPSDALIGYDLHINDRGGDCDGAGIADWAPHLLYPGQRRPAFVIKSRIDALLHGSCRRPHHPGEDGLARADAWLAPRQEQAEARPALLMLSGDQIYADDVAGPMLVAIHALIARLGLFGETLEGAVVADSEALYAATETYYHRERLLPEFESNEALRERFFGGVKKPIFTTASAANHLITFAEVLAMYLLVFSPVAWRLIAPVTPALGDEDAARYADEAKIIDAFAAELPAVSRVMAQLPTLMIFDDHDITDDWNLTAAWEETAYGNPFSRRIIGNALLAYLLCQGWGNDPDRLATPLDSLADLFDRVADERLPATRQDALIGELLHLGDWGYTLGSQPKLVVLDTRTRRWRSERARQRPSGLMDWEALTDFQQDLLDESAVIVVSPAPLFGVKLIEGVQRLFTLFGKPLLVDAENWMAHRGAASVILNIFRHTRTPRHYTILSGDVHYSFVYRVRIRARQQGPDIWQVTSSGIKNTFPDTLLDWFDRLNRWLYAPWSPLNWFTKRRRMRVQPLTPDRAKAGERLWNGAGIGYVRFDAEGRPSEMSQLGSDGRDTCFR